MSCGSVPWSVSAMSGCRLLSSSASSTTRLASTSKPSASPSWNRAATRHSRPRPEELKSATRLSYTTDAAELGDCNFYVVTVPTPIGNNNQPLLTHLRTASVTLAGLITKGDFVVYESTVYPGATEEFCVPILEEGSGLKMNEDFFVGYSPERINPGIRNTACRRFSR